MYIYPIVGQPVFIYVFIDDAGGVTRAMRKVPLLRLADDASETSENDPARLSTGSSPNAGD
ncbi:MAG: hypothetical protein AAF720_11010 [Pseudomonadota bacterium]